MPQESKQLMRTVGQTKKRIAMLGTSPEAKGGIATVVRNYQESGLMAKWGISYFVTHVQASALGKLRFAFASLVRLTGMLLTNRVALLHVHMSSRNSTWRKSAYILAALAFRVPYLIHMHSPDYVVFYERDCGSLRKRLIRTLLTRAKNILVLSASWAEDMRKIAPAVNVVVVYNSVPLPVLPMELVKASDQAPSVLFLGQVGERKGTFDLIRAAALIARNFKLDLGGDGDLTQAKDLVKELGLEDKVKFHGWVRGKDKDVLLANARLFVLPSYHEGVPMAILEAMSWGLPVITTPVGGIPEVVTNGIEGLLVAPGDIQGLAQALEQLVADPDKCRAMGAAGRERLERDFSQSVLHAQLEKLWRESGALPLSTSAANR
jgi:glycosyltransferase involved in cell wall biosynthesis